MVPSVTMLLLVSEAPPLYHTLKYTWYLGSPSELAMGLRLEETLMTISKGRDILAAREMPPKVYPSLQQKLEEGPWLPNLPQKLEEGP